MGAVRADEGEDINPLTRGQSPMLASRSAAVRSTIPSGRAEGASN